MTFDELQLIVQSIAIAQRESQAMQQDTQLLVQSIARGVQAMQEKALTDELLVLNLAILLIQLHLIKFQHTLQGFGQSEKSLIQG